MKRKVDRKQKAEKKRNSIWLFISFLSGIFLCIMLTMMKLGEGINFNNFLSIGRVYDFSEKEITKSSNGWVHDGERYWLQTNGSLKKFRLDGKERIWNYLYINIDEMSLSDMEASICYYNSSGEKVLEEPVRLYSGENIIYLNMSTSMSKMGIRVLNAKGQSFSIKSMQIRTTLKDYNKKEGIQTFLFFYVIYTIIFLILFIGYSYYKRAKSFHRKGQSIWYYPILILQYGFQIIGDAIGQRIGKYLKQEQKSSIRTLLFLMLFLWMIVGNVLDWNIQSETYRYYMLVCVLFIILIAGVSWEKELELKDWKNPIALSWIGICLGMIISDFMTDKSINMTGWVMLLVGGFFIFVWNNMWNRKKMIIDMLNALEIVAWIGTAYCMMFRTKRPAVLYNGIFQSSEEFAMYGVLILGVFLIKLDADIRTGWKPGEKLFPWIRHITGVAIALYFILRTANDMGYVLAVVWILFFLGKQCCLLMQIKNRVQILILPILAGCIVACITTCVVHVATKQLPEILQKEVEYQNEVLLTDFSDEEVEILNAVQPWVLEGVVQETDVERGVIWKNYIRKWNFWGNDAIALKIFRERTLAGNGYLMMAYRYGFFILLPYVVWQIAMIITGAKKSFRRKKCDSGADVNSWIFLLSISFIGFNIFGNAEMGFGHPLWICGCLGTGFWFLEEIPMKENNY